MDGGKVSREGGDVVIILPGVIGERRAAELTPGPGEIKRMSKQMFCGDLAVDGVEVLVHGEMLQELQELQSYKVTR